MASKRCDCFSEPEGRRLAREQRRAGRKRAISTVSGILSHATGLVGKLRPKDAGRTMTAAHAYAHALITGDVATAEQEAEQRQACAACPSRVDVTVRGKTASYCGPAFEDRLADVPPTCGCPIDGIALTSPAFKSCPQGKGPQP